MVRKSLYQSHCEKWQDGCGAEICELANKVVLCRGRLPCDVLFIGEAPGESENVIGLPFVGPAGKLLDKMIKKGIGSLIRCPDCQGTGLIRVKFPSAHGDTDNVLCPACNPDEQKRARGERTITSGKRPPRIAITNLVGCIPREAEKEGKAGQPLPEDVSACKPRLEELIRIAGPKLIVGVGTQARDYLDPYMRGRIEYPKGTKVVDIIHPSAILRAHTSNQGLLFQRAVVTLKNAVEDL